MDERIFLTCSNFHRAFTDAEIKELEAPAFAWALKKRIAVSTKTEKEKRMAENLQSSAFVGNITEEDMKRIGELNANLRKYFEPYSIP